MGVDMRIKGISVVNLRLLRDNTVGLKERTTVIFGRNNNGKTSIGELFLRSVLTAEDSSCDSIYPAIERGGYGGPQCLVWGG